MYGDNKNTFFLRIYVTSVSLFFFLSIDQNKIQILLQKNKFKDVKKKVVFFFLLTLDNYVITTMKNITDDSTVDNSTCHIRIHAWLHHLSRPMGSTLDGTPCAMLHISCKHFSPLIRIILSFPRIEIQTSMCRSINEQLVKPLNQRDFHKKSSIQKSCFLPSDQLDEYDKTWIKKLCDFIN